MTKERIYDKSYVKQKQVNSYKEQPTNIRGVCVFVYDVPQRAGTLLPYAHAHLFIMHH